MDPTNLTPAGDQYSLGCVLYFCLTGQAPFPDGTAAEKMMAHQFKEPAPVCELAPETPAALVAVVERLMKKAPEDRYANAAEVVEALRALAEVRPQPARAPARPGARVNPAAPAGKAPTPPPSSARPAMATMVNMPRPNLAGLRGSAAAANAAKAGGLPNRQSLKAAPPPLPEPEPEPEPVPEEFQEHFVPGAVDRVESRTWEERLGPIGITIGAIAACALAWFVASQMF